jgi:endonuclease YncB( thermonuclease family)
MRVYDGDTLTVAMYSISGLPSSHIFKAYQIRLFGCDCPELKGATKQAAIQAREEVLHYIGASGVIGRTRGKQENTWFQENPIIITIELMSESIGKIDKYGRELAHIHMPGKKPLSVHLIEKGLANEYQGGTKDQAQWEL